MVKKSLFLLLLVMCVGYCTPSMVYARDYNSKYYIEIDYQFSINYNDIDKEKLEFQLYDQSKSFVFNSVYDSLTDTYKFQEHSNSGDFEPGIHNKILQLYPLTSQFNNLVDSTDTSRIFNNYNGIYVCESPTGGCNWCQTGYDTLFAATVPMILELTGGPSNIDKFKKIVFLTLYNRYFISDNQEDYYCNSFCHTWWYSKVDYNFTLYMKNYISDEFDWEIPLIEFTRNAVYDYSDELWEELNNGPIASSEMNFENSSVVIGTSGAIDLSKPSVIQFNMKNNTINSEEDKNNKSESVIKKIANPKTWNNGVVILVISMIVIIGSSMLIIKKRNVKE